MLSNIKLCLFIANSISVSPLFPITYFTFAEKACYFRWQPNTLKLDCLPYDKVNFDPALGNLVEAEFIQKYDVGGQSYGVIPTFLKHQRINNKEPESEIPAPITTLLKQDEGKLKQDKGKLKQDKAMLEQVQAEKEREGKGQVNKGFNNEHNFERI